MTMLEPDERVMVERRRFGARVRGGVAAGVIAGIVMALWSMGHAAANGLGFWLPARLVAATWFGVESLIGGPAVIAIGVLTHVAVAAIAGGIFGLFVPGRTHPFAALVFGIAYGLLVLLVATIVVLPLVNPLMRDRVELTMFSWAVAHVLFGAFLVVGPLFARRGRAETAPYERAEPSPA